MSERQSGYLAIDMGLGKTRIVLEYILACHKRQSNHTGAVLVVAPLRVAVSTWPLEILKWTPSLSYTVLHGKDKDENFKLDRDIYIINYDGLKWLSKKNLGGRFFHGLLILDESTMVKSHSTSRFKLLKAMRAYFTKAFCLSATPAPNGYQDLWSQYFLLDRGMTLGQSWTKFFNRYWYQTLYYQTIVLSQERLKEIPMACARSTFRLKAADYLTMPKLIVNDIYIDLPSDLYKKYKELERDFVYQLSQEENITAVNAAVLSMKLRQFCQGGLYQDDQSTYLLHDLKEEALLQITRELQGEPNLVAIQFKFETQLIEDNLSTEFGQDTNIPRIVGGISADRSAKIINDWNNRKLPMLICHPASVSHGVNLQAGGHYITWLALPWSLEQYNQFIGRLYRQGQKHPVIVNRVLIRDTIESRIAEVLAAKNSTQESLLEVLRDFSKNTLTKL
jgi:SNF2 family DNA or RNA helicase